MEMPREVVEEMPREVVEEMPREVVVVHGIHRKIYKFDVYEDGREVVQFVNFDDIQGAALQNSHVDPEDARKKQLAREAVTDFIYYALEMEFHKDFLKKKFPRSVLCPHDSSPTWKVEWCSFCLGSKLCAKIYNEIYEEPSEEKDPRIPLLSIILYLNQHTLFKLFEHLHAWFLNVGMVKPLGRWVYAVLACTKKPLSFRFRGLLDGAYFDYVKRLEDCDDKLERSRLYMFLAILDMYFGVGFDEY